MSSCDRHGPHEGRRFVDGHDQQGRRWGRYETFCRACADEVTAQRYPHRGHGAITILREKRLELRLSLHEMAQRAGLAPWQLSQLEQGSDPPYSPLVRQYQDALGAVMLERQEAARHEPSISAP